MSMKYKDAFMSWLYIKNIFVWDRTTYLKFLKEKGLKDAKFFKIKEFK